MKRFSHGFALLSIGAAALAGTVNGCSQGPEASLASLGGGTAAPEASPLAGKVRVHYNRMQKDYDGWGVFSWAGPETPSRTWPTDRFLMTDSDSFGAFVDISLDPAQTRLQFHVIDAAGTKNCPTDQGATIPAEAAQTGLEVWVVEDDCEVYTSMPTIQRANLNIAKAHWLDRDTIVWPKAIGGQFKLYFASSGGLSVSSGAIEGIESSLKLLPVTEPLAPELSARFPHLGNAQVFKLPALSVAQMKKMLKGQLVVAQYDDKGALLQATALQTPGILDTLYASPALRQSALNEKLGVTFNLLGQPHFALWAPTAKSVKLRVFAGPTESGFVTYPMRENPNTGVWEFQGLDSSWRNRAYYHYEVDVFVRGTAKVETNIVTDPYSYSLTADSARSMVIDLRDASLMPLGWRWEPTPGLAAPEDTMIYETHVRDFSISDPSVPEAHRGKFLAFTHPFSNGMRHLSRLRAAGLNTIHLLPVFDIGTVPELAADQVAPSIDRAAGPLSESQQAAVKAVADKDGFNWGYDPVHYTAPEGSYATNAVDGRVRVMEFRRMVQALHRQGFRVVMDVVYNHTNSSGQAKFSILDRVVPGYYQRLDAKGNVSTSTCCSNTAAEHAMMEKLMVDSTRTWVEAYGVDGFRFDLMGHHMKRNIEKIQSELKKIKPDIYLYGEGWNFGEVADNQRGENATQANMAGTGVGTYSDRMRDAVRGGGPFDSGETIRETQGFASGLYTSPNTIAAARFAPEEQLATLLKQKDLVRLGLAGTLSNYSFVTADDTVKSGSELDYNGQKAGYTADPQEVINYVSKHDNQTLFDILQYKLPVTTSMDNRVRHNLLALSTVLYSQGVPFFHAGDDMLRSKSMERNSYNSGDWFNRLDFTYSTNNWAVGLPSAEADETNWPIVKELFALPELQPTTRHIVTTHLAFLDMVRVRATTPLLRLHTGEEINQRVSFLNTGAEQIPELIVMKISGSAQPQQQQRANTARGDDIYVIFNSGTTTQQFSAPQVQGRRIALHPVLAQSLYAPFRQGKFLRRTGTFVVPALTASVFVDHSGKP